MIRFLARFCCLAFAVLLVSSAEAAESVRIALNWKPEPEFGGFYEALLSGAYERAGLKVELLIGGSQTPVVQMVAAGKVEAGILGGDEIVIARDRGTDLIALFATYQSSPHAIMVHDRNEWKSLKDVFAAPGTLAIVRGQPYAQYLEKTLGYGKRRVVPYSGGVGAFLADPTFAQQCFLTSEPLLAKKSGAKVRVFPISKEGFDPYMQVLTVSRLSMSKATRLALVRATQEGWAAYLKSPKRANDAMHALNPTLDRALFEEISAVQEPLVRGSLSKDNPVGSMTAARWTALAHQLKSLGLIKKVYPGPEYLE